MKKAKLPLILLLAALFCFAGCQSTESVATSTVALEEVIEISATSPVLEFSKYGNTYVELTTADLLAMGFELGDTAIITAGEYTTEAPVVTSYSDVDRGAPLIKIDGENVEIALSYGNFKGAAELEVGDEITITLSEKGAYLTQYEIRQLKKSEERADYATDEIFANFRTMNVGNLKENWLYRSCNPALGDARAPFADMLAENAGIQLVVNLADSEESLKEHLAEAPYYEELYNDGKVVLLDMAVDFFAPEFSAKLKTGLEFIIDNAEVGPVLIHCNEGKDRAGMVASILEALGGATLEEITADYMRSFVNYYFVEEGSAQYNLIGKTAIDQFVTMNGGEAVGNSNVKSVTEAYLVNTVGLTSSQVEALESAITK